jgi:hypothetical protein
MELDSDNSIYMRCPQGCPAAKLVGTLQIFSRVPTRMPDGCLAIYLLTT